VKSAETADASHFAVADTMSLRGIAAAKRAYGESSPIVANALSVRASGVGQPADVATWQARLGQKGA